MSIQSAFSFREDTLWRQAVNFVLAFCILVFSIIGSSPELHEELHCLGHHEKCGSAPSESTEGSESGAHTCAITLLQSGLILGDGWIHISGLQAPIAFVTDSPKTKVFERERYSRQARAPPEKV